MMETKDNQPILMAKELFKREIKRDLDDIKYDKTKFIQEIKNGLGDKINDFNTYIKPEPTLFQKMKQKVSKIINSI